MGAVVTDLQHVDRGEQPAIGKPRLDRCLGIAGEERAERAELEPGDDRCVVDVLVGERPIGIGLGGIQDEQ